MGKTRVHKAGVVRREKKKEVRQVRQKRRQQVARGGLLHALRAFFTADSYMYGPLLAESLRSSGDPIPLSTARDQKEYGAFPWSSAPVQEDVKEDHLTVRNSDDDAGKPYHETRSTTMFVSVQRTLAAPAEEGDIRESGPVQVATIRHTEVREEETLLLADDEEGTSSMTGSYDSEEDRIPLEKEIARQVVGVLLNKVGGRYSKDLGIDVNAGDSEVERWFLAVTLFHRHLTFDVLKQTFKKLGEAGVTSVRDTLRMEENELADILETAGYTTYKHRAAAWLRKLARQLEAEYEGKVSSMKRVHDANELCRAISSLHGLTNNTAHTFLRELQGVWPGAMLDYDRRTSRAAMHLQLVGFDIANASKKLTGNPEESLTHISKAAGIDKRDVEVALVKLGLSHERHYRDCPGGLACHFLNAPA